MKDAVRELERATFLLKNKHAEIKGLKEELRGKEQIIEMLEAIILEVVEKKGTVEIPKDAISKGLKKGYSIKVLEDRYVLERKG